MASTTSPPSRTPREDPEPTLEQSRHSPWRIVGRAAIVVMLVGIAAMWLYAFFGHYEPPGLLADRSFPTAAEPVCQRARQQLATLPRAFETPTPAARADVVDHATDILDGLVADLRTRLPADEAARRSVSEWLTDWETYNRDRRDYTRQLRHDPMTRFVLTQSQRDRSQINAAVDNFAKVNAMASCATPDDVV